jgi:hypothetical protein
VLSCILLLRFVEKVSIYAVLNSVLVAYKS